MSRSRARSPETFAERQAARRRAGALEGFAVAVEDSALLEVPPRVDVVVAPRHGVAPRLSAEAFELARRVYYLQHGNLADCARAVIAAGLSETDELEVVRNRLNTWWEGQRWPKRPTLTTLALRDASNDGGLYRSDRRCGSVTTGNGEAPAGKRCRQSALADSDFCFHHDPRPRYVAARAAQAERLVEARRADEVPLEPLQRCCEQQRRRLLREARETGRGLHPNNRGWGLLADAMGIDASLLHRLIAGEHHRHPDGVTMIRAATVARYVAPLGLAFRDVYGYDAPAVPGAGLTCGCGRAKTPASAACRECYEAAQGARCGYVNRQGVRCHVVTAHESGYCAKCRRIVCRTPRPRAGRPTSVTAAMLVLATGEYREVPRLAWVARRMWACDAGGVREAFANEKSLAGSLVKQFRRRGWATVEDADAAHGRLVAEHGPVAWPARRVAPIEPAGDVPVAPFVAWLAARRADASSLSELAARTELNADTVSQWLRGTGRAGARVTVRRSVVDRALAAFGDGTSFADVYERRGVSA